ncbi:LPS-assembly protein LptD [Ahniella affigens]|uniref:LPS-assembly protein LptD n=2 Tax=Ahniella affigens TaxID=2021234 RepID=A0A2P1PLK7_9GAMM|nr:LPS-assembly protein LptD [Ahniella affigens]
MRMKMRLLALACLLPTPALAADTCFGALCQSCVAPLFTPNQTLINEGRDTADTHIEADRYQLGKDGQYSANGNVVMQRADQEVKSESATYQTEPPKAAFPAPLSYQDQRMLATAQSGTWSADDGTLLNQVLFQMRDGRGNGRAETASLAGPKSALTRATFTSCDPAHPAWSLAAQKIEIDSDKQVGRAENVRLQLGKVPIFYWPRMSFPTDAQRKTGFLYPQLGSANDSGFDLIVPYYLNLAPNYDATLKPRYIQERGLMLAAETRYLGEASLTEFEFSWLDHDRKADDRRTSFDFRHQQRFGANWFLNADIRDVSDDRYFEDFGDSLSSVATSLLPSSAYLTGRAPSWTFSVGGDRQEVTDPRLPLNVEPYRRLPRATFDYLTPNLSGPQFQLESELVRFSKDGVDGGNRLDLTPAVIWPLERSYGFLRPKLGYRYTAYELDRDIDSSPTRGMPIASLDSGLIFEREANWFGADGTQTLEPRVYALYVPYENQDNLPLFDTQAFTFGWGSLFRDNAFTGADRQIDAKQVTAALTTRYLDDAGLERFRFSLGQIRYLDPPRIALPGTPLRDEPGSAYVADLELNWTKDWTLAATHQYDPAVSATELSSVYVQRHFWDRGVVNVGYRYRRDLFEQVDVSTAIPIKDNWLLIARVNQSLRDDELLEGLAGFEYSTCCIAVRILGRRYVRNIEGDLNNGIYVELEFKGLGSLGRRAEDFLRRAILGYR